ncbi:DUF6069 family protein [Glycomyces salinus]|uniref:DUF6069 family protein n=1 Tax=Glycomyces salinus TaxID=980294 RepID=UPI0018EA5BEB|nr:DUF6069 family protein [Glycomyces salinus]
MNTRMKRLIMVVGAAVASLVLWIAAVPVGGVDLDVRQGEGIRTITPAMVVIACLAVGCAAWALMAVLERWTGRPAFIWTATAATVLAVSVLGPLGGIGAAAKLVLLAMHAVVAAILFVGLTRVARADRAEPARAGLQDGGTATG